MSGDPALQRVLNLAKMLGKAAPPRARSPVKKATFGLNPTKIRRLVNPKAPVKCCRVTLHRNISGYGNSAGINKHFCKLVLALNFQITIFSDIPKSQRIQIETLMKKVMGVAYMPEELTGKLLFCPSLLVRFMEVIGQFSLCSVLNEIVTNMLSRTVGSKLKPCQKCLWSKGAGSWKIF